MMHDVSPPPPHPHVDGKKYKQHQKSNRAGGTTSPPFPSVGRRDVYTVFLPFIPFRTVLLCTRYQTKPRTGRRAFSFMRWCAWRLPCSSFPGYIIIIYHCGLVTFVLARLAQLELGIPFRRGTATCTDPESEFSFTPRGLEARIYSIGFFGECVSKNRFYCRIKNVVTTYASNYEEKNNFQFIPRSSSSLALQCRRVGINK